LGTTPTTTTTGGNAVLGPCSQSSCPYLILPLPLSAFPRLNPFPSPPPPRRFPLFLSLSTLPLTFPLKLPTKRQSASSGPLSLSPLSSSALCRPPLSPQTSDEFRWLPRPPRPSGVGQDAMRQLTSLKLTPEIPQRIQQVNIRLRSPPHTPSLLLIFPCRPITLPPCEQPKLVAPPPPPQPPTSPSLSGPSGAVVRIAGQRTGREKKQPAKAASQRSLLSPVKRNVRSARRRGKKRGGRGGNLKRNGLMRRRKKRGRREEERMRRIRR